MTSIGGLDVAFGARMQVVRTNVMCLALASAGLANATTVPKFILNTYKEALKGKAFELNKQALAGAEGVWTHTNVRPDKYDLSPQPVVIEMIKSL